MLVRIIFSTLILNIFVVLDEKLVTGYDLCNSLSSHNNCTVSLSLYHV